MVLLVLASGMVGAQEYERILGRRRWWSGRRQEGAGDRRRPIARRRAIGTGQPPPAKFLEHCSGLGCPDPR